MAANLTKNSERYHQAEEMVARGATIREIQQTLKMDYDTIKRHFPNAGKTVGSNGGLTLDKLDPDKFKRMGQMVAEGCSLTEIKRTLHVDHRTIKLHFPKAGWAVGGSGRSAALREANRKLEDLDKNGRVKKNRDSGFNVKGGR